MDNWSNPVMAACSAVSALVAIYGTWLTARALREENGRAKKENDRALLSTGLQLVLQQDDVFSSPQMLNIRFKAARALLGREHANEDDVDDVLDFFERLAFLWRRGAVDVEMIWVSFFYWIHRYWIAGQGHVEKKQGDNKTVWTELGDLHEALVKLERKRGRETKDLAIVKGDKEIERFLEEEEDLGGPPPFEAVPGQM